MDAERLPTRERYLSWPAAVCRGCMPWSAEPQLLRLNCAPRDLGVARDARELQVGPMIPNRGERKRRGENVGVLERQCVLELETILRELEPFDEMLVRS